MVGGYREWRGDVCRLTQQSQAFLKVSKREPSCLFELAAQYAGSLRDGNQGSNGMERGRK